MYILSIVRALALAMSMVIWMLAYSTTLLFSKHTPERAFRLRRNWLRYMCHPILNIKVVAEGKAMPQAALYVCNHRSFADPLAILPYLDAYVIAKAEVASYPVINKGAELTGVLYVKREDSQSRNEVRNLMVKTIKEGYNVLVFPEGTVSFHSYPMPFRAGSFNEAAKEGIGIVPIAIEFRDKKDLWLVPHFIQQYLLSYTKWKTEVKVAFGQIQYDPDGEKLRYNCEQWITQKMAEMRKGWSTIDFTELDKKEPYVQALSLKRKENP